MTAEEIRALIEKSTQKLLGEEFPRGHLGASALGTPCLRALWYGFRWAHHTKHTGRLHRLFDRGHAEEDRVYRWLTASGFEVRPTTERLVQDPDGRYLALPWDSDVKPGETDVSGSRDHRLAAQNQGAVVEQFSFKDGHLGGSSDGMLRAPQGREDFGLLEVKTHSNNSFTTLSNKGVFAYKPQHYTQMQIYMHYFELQWGLYVAVNKNDDNMFYEIVSYDRSMALRVLDRATGVISSREAPPRVSKDPSWFACKFCDFREICHYGKEPQKNCRSCCGAEANSDGSWRCNCFGPIPKDFIHKGCPHWDPIS